MLNMVAMAAKQDEGFLLDLAKLQEKHVETAKLLLGEGKELNEFMNNLLDDISNLKAMLHAISIGLFFLKYLQRRLLLSYHKQDQ